MQRSECVCVGVQSPGTGVSNVEEQWQQQNNVFPWLRQLPDGWVSDGGGGKSLMRS